MISDKEQTPKKFAERLQHVVWLSRQPAWSQSCCFARGTPAIPTEARGCNGSLQGQNTHSKDKPRDSAAALLKWEQA